MKIHCGVLGFQIDRAVCGVSGNSPACRECSARELASNESTDKANESFQGPPECNAPGIMWRKARKRCECGRGFIPRSNRQRYCDRCGERNEAQRNRERQARFQKKASRSLGVTG